MKNKKREKKKESGVSGYSLAAAAYAMGRTGRVFAVRSSTPPPLEWTVPTKLISWPKKS